jgi:protein-tyrosine-phosphatase
LKKSCTPKSLQARQIYGCLKLPAKTVLFVCYGNIARSVIAESYLAKKSIELNLEVLSAGLNAQGLSCTKETLDIMKRERMSTPNHASRQLTGKLLQDADLILTMEERYKNAILLCYPQFENKVFTLREFAGETRNLDIKDPYGRNFEAYEQCAEEIKSGIDKSFKKILGFLGVVQ